VAHVLDKNTHMSHGFFAYEFLVHIRLKRQLLHIAVFTDFDKAFTALFTALPEPLHDVQHGKYQAVLFHEAIAGEVETTRVAGFQQLMC